MGVVADLIATGRTTFGIGPKGARVTLSAEGLTANREHLLPNKAGTVAMLSDIGSSGTTWTTVTSADVATAVTKTGYVMETGGVLRTVILPASAPQGFTITVNASAGQVRIVSNGNVIDGVGAGNNLLLDDGNTAVLVAKATGSLELLTAGNLTVGGLVPYFIPDGDSYNVAVNKQALFSQAIELGVNSYISADGYLIEVT